MSGTSMDGVDGILAAFHKDKVGANVIRTLSTTYRPFAPTLREELMALQTTSANEIHREALAGNALSHLYAECVESLLKQANVLQNEITAIGAHGQTIRHQPQSGYSRQLGNPALLAELTNINVIADFRSRDIAAGGQGAPLVPSFHQAIFGNNTENRIVVNIGGMSNITILEKGKVVLGFDTGPGNVLLDAWSTQHQGKAFDENGTWASSGKIIPSLLEALRNDAYLTQPPPKSTGRDWFHQAWLMERLRLFPNILPVDVQATLTAFTAITIAEAIHTYSKHPEAIYVCGGGTYNSYLMLQLQEALAHLGCKIRPQSTEMLGIAPNHVEALAFAWLAYCHTERQAGNLPSVSGAKGLRILGAHYPA